MVGIEHAEREVDAHRHAGRHVAKQQVGAHVVRALAERDAPSLVAVDELSRDDVRIGVVRERARQDESEDLRVEAVIEGGDAQKTRHPAPTMSTR